MKPLLAIETSTREGAVALLTETAAPLLRMVESGSHTSELLPTIDAILKEGGVSKEELALIAVSIGPGSYTGLRIGLTVAKTLALALGVKIVGVSTLKALALDAAKNMNICNGRIVPAVDARGGHLYSAKFSYADGNLSRIDEDVAIKPPALSEQLREGDYVFGTGANILELGSDAGVRVSETPIAPTALSVAELGLQVAAAEKFLDLTTAAPNYLRKTPAEIKRDEKNANA